MRTHFKKYSKSTGARWFLFQQISLNTRYFSPKSNLDDLGMLSLLVHEVRHLGHKLGPRYFAPCREANARLRGEEYHISWLPLYPIHKEIAYWLTRQEPI